jgi:type VI secretion system (T6SS) phospholipase Tle1-like effector
MHWTDLYQKFYDYTLNPNIPYAKHAISIDENRKDFRRVGWDPGEHKAPERDERGNIYFEQVWFPGDHADIGGGYEENESRLSDGVLHWMLIAATAIPHSIKFDTDVLLTYPVPIAKLHDEVKAGFGLITKLTGCTWMKAHRSLPSKAATMHKSVYERFDAREALEYDIWKPYRPETLRNHVDFARFYRPGATFPATSLSTASALADDPEARNAPVA